MSGRILLDDEGRLRLAWRVLIFGAGVMAVQIAVGVGAFVLVAATLAVRGEPLDLGPGGEAAFRNRWMLPLTIIAAPFITAGTTLLAIVMRRFLDRRSVWSLGLTLPRPWPRSAATFMGGTLAGAAPILLAMGVLVAMGGYRIVGSDVEWMAWAVLATLVLMAFFEEILFRGYLLRNFLDAGRPVLGVLLTSVLFWLAHSLNPEVWRLPWNSVNLISAGVLLALAYMATDDLWLPTAMHFGWNATQGVLFDIPISGMKTPGLIRVERSDAHHEWLTGGPFGLEGSALTSALLAAMIAVLLVVVRRKRRRAGEEVFVADAVEAPPLAEEDFTRETAREE